MVPVELDTALDLADRVIHERERLGAVAAFVGGCSVELGLRGAKVIERCLHVRLVREDLTGDEPDCESEEENKGG